MKYNIHVSINCIERLNQKIIKNPDLFKPNSLNTYIWYRPSPEKVHFSNTEYLWQKLEYQSHRARRTNKIKYKDKLSRATGRVFISTSITKTSLLSTPYKTRAVEPQSYRKPQQTAPKYRRWEISFLCGCTFETNGPFIFQKKSLVPEVTNERLEACFAWTWLWNEPTYWQ